MAGCQGIHRTSVRTGAVLLGVLLVASDTARFAVGDPPGQLPAGNLLVLHGQVLKSDGKPAVGATVSSLKQVAGDELVTTTDGEGRFEIVDQFGTDARVYAVSADKSEQATWRVPAMHAKSMFEKSHQIHLQPAVSHRVLVRSDRQGVEGAWVVVQGAGADFRVTGQTDAQGEVILRIPAQVQLENVSAWHPQRGVAATRFQESKPARSSTELDLALARTQSFRIADPAGEPVTGVPIALNPFMSDGSSFPGALVLVSQPRSDANGIATATWFPREDVGVHITLNHPNWIVDQSWQKLVLGEIKTLTIRPKHLVHGKLNLPPGVNGAGLLIQSRGFGPGNLIDTNQTRAQADGSFSLMICAQYRYWISVVDLDWASDPWTGLILEADEAEPAPISIPVYAAKSLEVRVTRGPDRRPIEAAYVLLSGRREVDWKDEKGRSRSGALGIHQWVQTDERGISRLGAGKGQFEIRVSSNGWEESRTLEVGDQEPAPIEFYRAWDGKRSVTGTATLDGVRFVPNAGTLIKAWGINSKGPGGPLAVASTPEVGTDGLFRTSLDGDLATAFIHDRERRVAGMAAVGPETSKLEITLTRNGSLSGSLTGQVRQPVAGVELDLQLKTTLKVERPGGYFDFIEGPVISVAANCVTDAGGRFHFTDVPTDVPLRLRVVKTGGAKGYVDYDREIRLNPGERREDEVVRFNPP